MSFMTLPTTGPYGSSQICQKARSCLLPHMWAKIKCMVMMAMKPYNKIVKFMTPGSGVQAVGLGQYGPIVKMY